MARAQTPTRQARLRGEREGRGKEGERGEERGDVRRERERGENKQLPHYTAGYGKHRVQLKERDEKGGEVGEGKTRKKARQLS